MIPNINFRFKITNFIKLCTWIKVGADVESKPLTITDGEEKYVWTLKLYPKGSTEIYQNHLSIHCILRECKISIIRAECECTIPLKRSHQIKFKSIRNMSEGMKFSWENIIDSDILQNKLIGSDITLFLNIRIWFRKNSVIKPIPILKSTTLSVKVEDTILSIDMNVLTNRSSVFSKMFLHEFKERRENKIEISDFSSCVVEVIFLFLNNNTLKLESGNVEEILRFADMYEINDLKCLCKNYYLEQISTENVITIYTIAELYNAIELRNVALYFMVFNIDDINKKYKNQLTSEIYHKIISLLLELNPMINQITGKSLINMCIPTIVLNEINNYFYQ